MHNRNFIFFFSLLAETTILRIQPPRIPLLTWAESIIAEFNSDAVFSEVGRTIRDPVSSALNTVLSRLQVQELLDHRQHQLGLSPYTACI